MQDNILKNNIFLFKEIAMPQCKYYKKKITDTFLRSLKEKAAIGVVEVVRNEKDEKKENK